MSGVYLSFDVDVGELVWFDGQGDNPVTAKVLGAGPLGTVEAVIAHHIRTRVALGQAARTLAAKAEARLAMHRQTGAARIGITGSPPNALDYEVYLEDAHSGQVPNRSAKYGPRRSAIAIEFGHRLYTKDGTPTDKRVKGLYILTGAAGIMARTPRKRWPR